MPSLFGVKGGARKLAVGGIGWRGVPASAAGTGLMIPRIIILATDISPCAPFAPGPIPERIYGIEDVPATGSRPAVRRSVSVDAFKSPEAAFNGLYTYMYDQDRIDFDRWKLKKSDSSIAELQELVNAVTFPGDATGVRAEPDGGFVVLPYERFGTVGHAWVAPEGAATVVETVDELVRVGCKVIGLTNSRARYDPLTEEGLAYPFADQAMNTGYDPSYFLSALAYLTGAMQSDGKPMIAGLQREDEVFRLRPSSEVANQLLGYVLELADTNGTATGSIDIALALDDTGSFAGNTSSVVQAFLGLIDLLRAQNRDIAVGVSRFEEYASDNIYVAHEGPTGRPFVLQQAVTPLLDDDDYNAVVQALNTGTPGGGGDGPETPIEALWQLATGLGFDAPFPSFYQGATNDEPVRPNIFVRNGSTFDSGLATVQGTYEEYVALYLKREDEAAAELGLVRQSPLSGSYFVQSDGTRATSEQTAYIYWYARQGGVGYSYPGHSGDVPGFLFGCPMHEEAELREVLVRVATGERNVQIRDAYPSHTISEERMKCQGLDPAAFVSETVRVWALS